jgi:hypothetical protein
MTLASGENLEGFDALAEQSAHRLDAVKHHLPLL